MKNIRWIAVLACLTAILCGCGNRSRGNGGTVETTAHTHVYSDTVVPPSCTDGYTIHACAVCGYSYTDTYIAANGHRYQVTTPDCACDVMRQRVYQCEVCGYAYSEPTEEKGARHDYEVKLTVAPSMTEEGFTLYACARCGEELRADYTDRADFSMGLSYEPAQGGVTVTGRGTCQDLRVVIPSVNEHGEKVVSITQGAWENDQTLEAIQLPSGIFTVGTRAFLGCAKLKVVEYSEQTVFEAGALEGSAIEHFSLPTCMKDIPERLLADCTGLKTVVLHEGVTVIGKEAFSGCSALSLTALPEAVERLGEGAFYGCKTLTSFTLPPRVTAVPASAFYGCASLRTVILHNGVNYIGERAFYSTALTEVELTGAELRLEKGAFSNCKSLERVELGQGIQRLPENVFAHCSSLNGITVSSSVVTVEKNAFLACFGLRDVRFDEGVTRIGETAFQGCTSLENVTLPMSLREIGRNAFSGCSALARITIPQNVTAIRSSFTACRALKEVYFCAHSCSLEEVAFPYAERIVFGGSVERIPSYICRGNTRLKTVVFEGNVSAVNAYAFDGCSALESVTLPSSLLLVGERAFYGTAIRSLTLTGGTLTVKKEAFAHSGVRALTALAEDLTLGEGAFYACADLTEVDLNGTVTALSGRCFAECGALQALKNVERLRIDTFDDLPMHCYTLQNGLYLFENILVGYDEQTISTETVVPEGVTYIAPEAFYECDLLRRITLPSTLLEVGDRAFYGCVRLQSIVLPNRVTHLGESVFEGCSVLTEITFSDALEHIPSRALQGCGALTRITFGKALRSVAKDFYSVALENGDPVHTYLTVCFRGTADAWERVDTGEDSILSKCDIVCTDRTVKGILLLEYTMDSKQYVTVDTDLIMTVHGEGEVVYFTASEHSELYGQVKKLVIPQTITFFEGTGFSYFTSLEEVVLHADLTYFPFSYFENSPWYREGAFYENGLYMIEDRLMSVSIQLQGELTIPKEVVYVSDHAFDHCQKLTAVNIPEGVIEIGREAFRYCTSLQTVSLPQSLKSLGFAAFMGCKSLKSLTIPPNVEEVYDPLLLCESAEYIVLTGGTRILEGGLVSTCDNLKYIVLGDGITTLPSNTAKHCPALQAVVIPSTVTEITEKAFFDCPPYIKLLFSSQEQADALTQKLSDKATYTYEVYLYSSSPLPNDTPYWYWDEEGRPVTVH